MFGSREQNRRGFPYATVPKIWPGETVACVASGPSLLREDVERLRGRVRTIVINTTYTLAPWADVLYAADNQWWDWHKGATDFAGMKFSVSTAPHKRWGVQVLKKGERDGLSLDPQTLCLGKDSGYQAINLAVLFGASRIILLGYDMQRGPMGERHWHGDHRIPTPNLYPEFLLFYPSLAARLHEEGVEVLNATRRTALHVFTRVTLDKALGEVAA